MCAALSSPFSRGLVRLLLPPWPRRANSRPGMDFQTAAVGWWPSCEGACRAIARPYLSGRRVRQRSACLFTRIRFSFPICQLFFGTCFVCSPWPRVICKLSTFVPTLFYFTFYSTQFIVFSCRSFASVYRQFGARQFTRIRFLSRIWELFFAICYQFLFMPVYYCLTCICLRMSGFPIW